MDENNDERNLSYLIKYHYDELIKKGVLELNLCRVKNLEHVDDQLDLLCKQAIDTVIEILESSNHHGSFEKILKKDAITYLEDSKNRAISVVQLLIHRLKMSTDSCFGSETLDNLLNKLYRASNALDSIKHADKYVTDTEALCMKVVEELLPKFVKMHSTYQAGTSMDSLDFIQSVVRKMDKIICKLCNRSTYQSLSNTTTALGTRLEHVYKQLSKAHIELIKRSILVESQPSQLLKKMKKFEVVLRFLLNNRLQFVTQPGLEAYYITERERHLLHPDTDLGCALDKTPTYLESSSCGEIFKFKGQLTEARAQKAQGNERVTDKKCAILFRGTFHVRCPWSKSEQKVSVQTWSLPVVLIVHTNQEQDARATVWWDREFPVPSRTAFDVRENIPWPEFKAALSCFFKDQTKRELEESQLFYVGQKLLFHGGASLENEPYSNVSFLQLVHQMIPDREFSCWAWLWQVIRLIQKHLTNLWEEGLIEGFVFRDHLADIFTGKPYGTFILRFSESQLGYVVISFLNESDCVLQWPYNDAKLQKFPLISDLLKFNNFLYFMNGQRKEDVLQKYAEKEDETPLPGYVVRGYTGPLLQRYQECLDIEVSGVNLLSPDIYLDQNIDAMDCDDIPLS